VLTPEVVVRETDTELLLPEILVPLAGDSMVKLSGFESVSQTMFEATGEPVV
jgi:hypothetical protein